MEQGEEAVQGRVEPSLPPLCAALRGWAWGSQAEREQTAR